MVDQFGRQRARASRTWWSRPRSAWPPRPPGRPSFGVRFATKLPNASNESGLGLDTTDFYASILVGKTVGSVRMVGNVGFGILGDPTRGDRQNDVLTYGISVRARADQGRRDRGRGERPHRHARRRAAARHGNPRRRPRGRALHDRRLARRRRRALRGDVAAIRTSGCWPGSPTSSTRSRCRRCRHRASSRRTPTATTSCCSPPTRTRSTRPPTARAMCHRHTGIGADGLILFTTGPRSATMRLLERGRQPVGTVRQRRCAVWPRWWRRISALGAGATVRVDTDAGPKTLEHPHG